MRFLVIPELRGRWSWELRDAANRVLASSALSFMSRERALASIQEFRTKIFGAPLSAEARGRTGAEPVGPGGRA